MKKNTEKNYRKRKLTIIGGLSVILAIVLVFLIPVALIGGKANSQKQVVSSESNSIESDTGENDNTSDKGTEKEIHLMNYDDLVDNDNSAKDDSDNISVEDDAESKSNPENDSEESSREVSDVSKNSTEDGQKSNIDKDDSTEDDVVTVIDESPSTIKDESKQNEYKGNESQNSIEFFDVEPSGADVNGDVPASGKHVGTWN